ncbi:MAG TPA: hypothetical protein VGI82_00650 [Chitinophagaceae bacterium]
MLKLLSITFFSLFLFSCTSRETGKNKTSSADSTKNVAVDSTGVNSTSYYKVEGDSLVIPPFDIAIDLSPKASEKLKKIHETIIVAAYFSGIPKDTTTKEYLKSGGLGITTVQKELSGNDRTTKIEGGKFPKSLYDSLSDKDIQVLINVYSGRRSNPNNLLDCDILEEKMSAVKGKTFTLKGKLIGER